MKFVILTDPHFVPPGEMLFGLDPRAHLAQAIQVVNRDHPDIAFVILLGDLTNRGEAAAYSSLAETLGPLNAPLIPMTGNHDSRIALSEALPQADRDACGFIQGLRVFESASIVTLDTLDEAGGTGAGLLCADRLAFLESALADAPADRPLLVFQHHPPFETGLKAMDRIMLRNPEDEWAAFERIRRPDHLFMGHLHRPISGSWRGIPFHIQRGVSHQVGFDFDNVDGITGSYEGPDYALVEVGPEGVVIHQRPFLFEGPRFSLRDEAAQRAVRRLE